VARRERDGAGIGLGRVEKDGRAGRTGGEPHKQTIGGFLIVGEQRSDFETFAARPQNAGALQPSLIDDAERDSLRLPDPGLEEFCARRGESGLVITQDFLIGTGAKSVRPGGAAPPPLPF
jgi:hypothetical protein